MTTRRPPTLAAAGPNVRQLSARRLATRTRLLDAAQRVFIERGIFASTVEEICDAAGFTRGAFYSNFADKEALIEAVLLRESEAILGVLARLADAPEAALRDTAVRPVPASHRSVGAGHPAGGGIASPGSGGSLASGTPSGSDDLSEVLTQFFRAQPLGRDHYLLHTELRLAAMRDPGAHDMFHELSARQWSRMSQAVLALLRRIGREPTVPIEDLIELLYGILERSTARALIEDDEEVDALARRLLPTVVGALTAPIGAAARTATSPTPDPTTG